MSSNKDIVKYKIIDEEGLVPAVSAVKKKRIKKDEREIEKIRFSIGAKLITIISIIVLLSLGSITALVSWLVREDLRVAAEEQNFELNRKNALEAENIFNNIQSQSVVLIQVIQSAGKDSDLAQETVKTFFEQNKNIAAVFTAGSYAASDDNTDDILISGYFKITENEELPVQYVQTAMQRINQEKSITILNATADFGEHLLAMIFPWSNTMIGVLFTPSALSDSFNLGLNKSYLINGDNDILIYPDFERVREGVNLSDDIFIKTMRSSLQRNLQTLYTDENGVRYFSAFTKMNTGDCALITKIEYDKVFEGIEETTRRNMYLTAAVLCISIMLIWFFAKTISVPLQSLSAAAQRIEGGQFEIDIKPKKGKDEISMLGFSFQKMSRALGIFGRFTNKEIALLAMRGQIKPGGLSKKATIFFSDIRGFTEKSENFTKKFGNKASDKIVFWLNNYLSKMVECVEKTGGTIDKFIGDAVMAHWGTATTSGNPYKDALNCVGSALLMRSELIKMNKERKPDDEGNPAINIGCGINSGIVTAGQIGSEKRMEYTVIGDPVNLASRIESLCKPLGADILISESTWNMIKEHIIAEEMPSVTVKGKEKPVRLFAVVNLKAAKGGPKTLEHVRKLLGIKPPDLENVNLDAEEKKYNIPPAEKNPNEGNNE